MQNEKQKVGILVMARALSLTKPAAQYWVVLGTDPYCQNCGDPRKSRAVSPYFENIEDAKEYAHYLAKKNIYELVY